MHLQVAWVYVICKSNPRLKAVQGKTKKKK
ncbi:50S ribosomal protein L36 [Vibrio quintilis]